MRKSLSHILTGTLLYWEHCKYIATPMIAEKMSGDNDVVNFLQMIDKSLALIGTKVLIIICCMWREKLLCYIASGNKEKHTTTSL